jgi:uncharacterized membrane protein
MDDIYGKYIPRSRLLTLADGVYTVAFTLLVTSLGLPEGYLTDDQFEQALIAQAPKIMTWLLSAWVIIFNWISFVRISQFTDKLNHSLLFFILAQIGLISLIPFTTTLIGEHWQHRISVVIYTANLWLISAIEMLRITYVQGYAKAADADPEALDKWSKAYRINAYGASIALILAYTFPVWNLLAIFITTIWVSFKSRNSLAPSI